MTVSRISTLENSRKYITLAIDGYANRELQGRIYHEALDNPVCFSNVMDMITYTEHILGQIRYPAPAFEERCFKKMESLFRNCTRHGGEAKGQAIGQLATASITIKHRQNATWRGEVNWIENNQKETFESFLKLLLMIDKRMKSLVCLNAGFPDEYKLNGVMDLMRTLNRQLLEQKKISYISMEKGHRMVPGQTLKLCRVAKEQTTFLIRVLFKENHTWQGTIQWKERREQASFRSFLELVKLMDINLSEWNAWNSPQEWETEKYYWNYS